jgi:FKBP-type peptidyl-prolyl cis-trans isomerase
MLTFGVLACHHYDGQTEHGYDYWHHLNSGGEKPAFGDEIYIYFQIRTRDTLLFTSPNSARGMRTVLQNPSLNPIKKPDPVADVLPLMSEGDSVTVVMEVTEEMRAAPGLETADLLYYDVVLRKIIPAGSREEYDAKDGLLNAKEELSLAKPDFREALEQDSETAKILQELARFKGGYRHLGISSSSGLWYTVLEKGTGNKLSKGEVAQIKYIGCLSEGIVFGENFTEASSFSFTAGQGSVIKAWEETLSIIGPGGKVFIAVPPSLGYGKLGKAPFIEPQDTLFYYFELEKDLNLSQ